MSSSARVIAEGPFARTADGSSHLGASAEACPSRQQDLNSYGGEGARGVTVFEPRSLEQLRDALRVTRERKAHLTLRGGGCSFDTQSLGNDVVIVLSGLADIEVDAERATVTTGPGATWRDVVRAAAQHALVPYNLVTTRDATVGGTASADCLSRFSVTCGKEGWQIQSFDLLSVEGELFHCSREQNRELFFAAIGGFGYLGVMTRITYRVLRAGPLPLVETLVIPEPSIRELISALAADVPPHAPTPELADMRGGYGAWSDKGQALRFRCNYVAPTEKRRTFPILHEPYGVLRVVSDIILRIQWIARLMALVAFWFIGRKRERYVDEFENWAFFMDGNSRAKQVGRAFGAPMRSLQQTFVVPADLPAVNDAAFAHSIDLTTRFIEGMADDLRARGIMPSLFDCLYIHKDEEFLLSSCAEHGGFAISVAFDTSNQRILASAREALIAASKRCREVGGRVHLVKNVCVDPADLAAMYEPGASAFFALKRRLDPRGMLRNEFLERLFPSYL